MLIIFFVVLVPNITKQHVLRIFVYCLIVHNIWNSMWSFSAFYDQVEAFVLYNSLSICQICWTEFGGLIGESFWIIVKMYYSVFLRFSQSISKLIIVHCLLMHNYTPTTLNIVATNCSDKVRCIVFLIRISKLLCHIWLRISTKRQLSFYSENVGSFACCICMLFLLQ